MYCLKCYNFIVTIYIMLQCLKCFNLHKLVLNSINSKIFYKLLQNGIFPATFSIQNSKMCYHKNSVGLTVTMTEKCFVKNNCHSLVYCKDTGYVTLKSLNNEEIECLRLRSGLEFQERSEICLYQYHFYLKACSNCYKVAIVAILWWMTIVAKAPE